MHELRPPLHFPSIPDQHLIYVLMKVLMVSSTCGFPTQNVFCVHKKKKGWGGGLQDYNGLVWNLVSDVDKWK